MTQAAPTPCIVTFCTADYIAVAENWLHALAALGLEDQALVVALDPATRDALAGARVLYRPLPPQAAATEAGAADAALGALWSHRIEVLRALLAEGVSVIHSDADAIWLRDPRPDIAACAAPLVFSQGTYWPPDVHARRGLVLCCGLFFLQAGPASLRFLDAVRARMAADRDDQVAMNRVVDGWIDGWRIEDPQPMAFGDIRFTTSRRPIQGRGRDDHGHPVAVAVLPHHAYPRLLERVTDDTVVAHPLSGKTLAEKALCLGRLGLWTPPPA